MLKFKYCKGPDCCPSCHDEDTFFEHDHKGYTIVHCCTSLSQEKQKIDEEENKSDDN